MKPYVAHTFKNQKMLILPEEIINNISRYPFIKNLFITDIGFFPHAKYHYIERKEGCRQNILIYCTNGEGFVIIDGKKTRICKNTLLIIPKDLPHIYGSNDENPWDIYWMHFKGETDSHFVRNTGTITLIDVPLSTLPVLIHLFDEIFDALSRGSVISNIIYACSSLSYFLATALFMPYNKYGQKDRKTAYVENSIEFMKNNIDKRLTLNDLTSYNNLSKTQLTDIFKEKTGYSPIDFFIRLKIQKACFDLDFTDMSVSEIAEKIGYSDQFYFSRLFKKIMGSSPSDYRRIKKG
ncbi:MAG TPA: AraC family transcriptional regulator [Clostridiaceae bacterium]|nr:AraC family transcriptional regulator [Clostridiaceae bacterium]